MRVRGVLRKGLTMKKLLKILTMTMIVAAMCVAFAACGGSGSGDGDDYEYAAQAIENGTEFGSFTSTDLDGNEVTEAIFADKDLTVLNIWGTYCGPCKSEMPELADWAKELPDNVQIVGMVIDVPEGDADMIKTAKEICADTGVDYLNITDNDSVEALLESVEAIPTTFILDSEGKTVCTPIVGADVEAYKQAVQEYLDE